MLPLIILIYLKINFYQFEHFQQGKRCLSGGRDGDLKLWNLDPECLADQPFNFEHVNISSCLMSSSHHANVSQNVHCFSLIDN